MTSKPFGVNITLLPTITPPDYVGYARVIVEEGINIVETAGSNPRPVIEVFRNAPYKVYILHKYLPHRSNRLGLNSYSKMYFNSSCNIGSKAWN